MQEDICQAFYRYLFHNLSQNSYFQLTIAWYFEEEKTETTYQPEYNFDLTVKCNLFHYDGLRGHD